jgi:amicyanin
MNKNILIVIIVILVIVTGAVYFWQQPKSTQNNQSNQPISNEANGVLNITIQNFSFNPAELSIKKGSTVTWTNQDAMPHKISGSSFQSDALNKGRSFSFTFDTAGTFDYVCSIHPYMKGRIIVQ